MLTFSKRAILIMLLQCTTHIPNADYCIIMLIAMAESEDLVDVS